MIEILQPFLFVSVKEKDNEKTFGYYLVRKLEIFLRNIAESLRVINVMSKCVLYIQSHVFRMNTELFGVIKMMVVNCYNSILLSSGLH